MTQAKAPKKKTAPARPAKIQPKIEVWIAAILMLIAFGVGYFVRGATEKSTTTVPIEQQVPGGTVQAPPLTDQQLNGGVLPSGHPTYPSGGTTGQVPSNPNTSGNSNQNANQGNN